jgi:hypothetical protein
MKYCFGLVTFQTLGGKGMAKGKFVLLSILVAAVICWQFLPMNTQTASSGIIDPCESEASFCNAGGSACLIVCPSGDATALSDEGNEICVTIKDLSGAPIPGMLGTDFWLTGCGSLVLCGGSGSSNADAATDINGQTQFSGAIAAGGCDTGLYVVCQGIIIGCPGTCLAIDVRSPDLSGDLGVDLIDFTIFKNSYPPHAYYSCADYDCSGAINLVDFTIFARHWHHYCAH